MKPILCARSILVCSLLLPWSLQAASILPASPSERLALADATIVAKLVTHRTRVPGGKITTDFIFRTNEAIRGSAPPFFIVNAPGGIYGDRGDANSLLPNLYPQKDYLLFLSVDGFTLGFLDGPAGALEADAADLTALRDLAATLAPGTDLSAFATDPVAVEASVTPSGLIDGGNGFRRFTLQDRGVPIPVYADVSTRPAGISEAEALTALENALDAWEAVTSLLFSFEGTEVFPQTADSYGSGDGLVIRVQMHDNFGQIPDASTTLGQGGAGFSLDLGDGATVDGNAFNPITYGYVIMNHPKAALTDPVAFEEVLTHEIGHVIGMAHSSETSPEPDSSKAEAMMYYQAHLDGRGATLNSYDTTTILQAYPLDTPPYTFDRVFYAVTSPWQPLARPEVNKVTLVGGDLQGQSLTLQQESASTSNGTFALSGSTLTYTPNGYFLDADVGDPQSSWFDRYRARFSDGTHLSPYAEIRVIGFRGDTEPAGAPDGVPDTWMTTYFGSDDGSTAGADPDGDGFDNTEEFLLGTDPTDGNSRLQVSSVSNGSLQWTTQRFDVYRVRSTTEFTSWTTERLLNQPDDSGSLSVSGLPGAASGDRYFRVERID